MCSGLGLGFASFGVLGPRGARLLVVFQKVRPLFHFHGLAPRSPLRRLSVRLRRSRSYTSTECTRSQGLLNLQLGWWWVRGVGGGQCFFTHDLSITIMSCNHVEPLSAAGALLLAPSSLLHLSTHYRITHQHRTIEHDDGMSISHDIRLHRPSHTSGSAARASRL